MKRFLLGLALLLSGCAHLQPAPAPGCALTAYPLRVDERRALAPAPDFESVLRSAMSAPAVSALDGRAVRPSVLILSGGSQNGAFGAGLFAGMPSVPDYKLVTGVSTGALQSTFVFLANTPVPADRSYARYMKAAGAGAPHSNVGDLALAYSIEREGDLLKVGSGGQLGGVVRGSIATFAPLRRTLAGLLSPATLAAVGAAYDPDPQRGRRLLVGVTDVNDGAGYAIDLTELASRVTRGTQPYEAVRNCYVDALIASSSVPLAAPPVTLERRDGGASGGVVRHMYVDGGARFGVFWSQLGAVLAGGLGPEVSLIVNGRLYGKPWLDKAGRQQTSWSALPLALRTVDLLENEVYRFSIENVERVAGAVPGGIRMAFISNQNLSGSVGIDPDDFSFEGKTCREWNDTDNLAHPTEFHPRFMRCLIGYGRIRGAAKAWNIGE